MTGLTSDLTITDLKRVANTYPFPEGTILVLSEEGGLMTSDYSPFFSITMESLKGGYYLPLFEMAGEVCTQLEVNPVQLHHNVWRNIVTFDKRCKDLGLHGYFDDFQTCYMVKAVSREVGLYALLSKSKMEWRHPDHVTE